MTCLRRSIIGLIFFLAIGASLRHFTIVSTSASLAHRGQQYELVKGKYVNYDYGYSVVIPRNFTGLRSRAPAPNHGFVINIPGAPGSDISVDASYNASEWKSSADALNAQLDWFKNNTGRDVTVMVKKRTVLGGLRAFRFVLRSERAGSNSATIRDIIIAFRKRPGDIAIVYEISLTTPAGHYEQDKTLVRQLQRAFRVARLPV